MRNSIKSLLHLAGNILAIAGVGFVGMKVWGYAGEINLAQLTPALWGIIAGLAAAYGCANLLLAIGWQKLLAQLGRQENAHWCIRTYGLSQIAKYVPGNVFQFAGRQAMGMSRGIGGWVLARSSFWELALLCLSGSLFGVLVLPAFCPGNLETLACALFLLLGLLSVLLINRFVGRFAAQALLMYLGFLAISGAIFVVLISVVNVDGAAKFNWAFLAGTFVVAWLIGLITPGAPAGVGVREAVIAIILNGALPMREILLVVMFGRLVTVSGDILFCIVASRLQRDN